MQMKAQPAPSEGGTVGKRLYAPGKSRPPLAISLPLQLLLLQGGVIGIPDAARKVLPPPALVPSSSGAFLRCPAQGGLLWGLPGMIHLRGRCGCCIRA